MANSIEFDRDTYPLSNPENGSLLSSDDQLTAGIRVTRAQFARMMGCSRQAVTDWVRAGRLTVGADGRFDPCRAVADLLRTGDPARLRAKVLQPLADELSRYRVRIVDLEAGLGQALRDLEQARGTRSAGNDFKEDREFYEGAIGELHEIFNALVDELRTNWSALVALPGDDGANIIIGWLNSSLQRGVPGPLLAPAVEGGEGEGEIGFEIGSGYEFSSL